jgi:5-aminopentanamidase
MPPLQIATLAQAPSPATTVLPVSTVRVACHQLAPVIGELDANRARALAALDAAAAAGAQVVVLPELAASGYVFHDAHEARALAEPADGPTLAGWA